MHAVVLVGGFGTRLRPLTNTVPKAMLPIAHVPLLVRLIGQLEAGGVDHVTLALGFLPEPFVAAFPDGRCGGVRLDYAIEPEPLDTAGAIRFAADHAGIDDTFVVANGDVLTDLSIADLVAAHRAADAEATIHLIGVDDPSAFGVVELDDERSRSLRFVEKPPPGTEPSNLINAGTYVLEPSVLDAHPARRAVLDRARHVPRHRRRRALPLAGDRRLLDRRRPPGPLPAGQPRPRQRPPRRGVRRRSTRGPDIAADARASPTAWSATPTSVPDATVAGSVVLPGARDRRRRGRRGLHRRRLVGREARASFAPWSASRRAKRPPDPVSSSDDARVPEPPT